MALQAVLGKDWRNDFPVINGATGVFFSHREIYNGEQADEWQENS